MRKNYNWKSVLLALFLTASAAVPAFAVPVVSTPVETEAVVTPETEAQPETEPDLSVYKKKSGTQTFLYYTATNEKCTGLTGRKELPKGSGDYYYFVNAKGQIQSNTWFDVGKRRYYADRSGLLASGFKTIKKKNYYFKPGNNVMAKGWARIDGGERGYFNELGIQQLGFQQIGGYTFYLDPEDDGIRSIGWTKIGNRTYYFNAKGRMQTGIITVDGEKYYMNSAGVKKTGMVTIDENRYFFDKEKNGAMQTGWVLRKNKTYYFSASTGKAVKGWMTLDGKSYYFNTNGAMVTGWMTLNGKKYYLDKSDGHMLTGKQTIDGKTYDFGKDGYLNDQPTGEWSIKVNQGTCVVTIYRGTTPIKAMLCSVGLGGATPNGTFSLGIKRHWHALFGNVWGQYTSHITGNILFHSVYYYRYRDPNSLCTEQYNKLGSPASAGCVRLNCADAYYIYTQVPQGTKVTIFVGSSKDDPLGKPAALRITGTTDPTDPIPND